MNKTFKYVEIGTNIPVYKIAAPNELDAYRKLNRLLKKFGKDIRTLNYLVVDMSCKGCEERRKKIKELYDESTRRINEAIARLTGKPSGSEQQTDRAEQPANKD